MLINDREILLTRFTQLELLQGSWNEKEWTLLSTYLEAQNYIELTNNSWPGANSAEFDRLLYRPVQLSTKVNFFYWILCPSIENK